MNTLNLSQTPQHVAVSSLPKSHTFLSIALYRLKTFLTYSLVRQELPERSYPLLFLVTPTCFSRIGIYTPLQDWNGYR